MLNSAMKNTLPCKRLILVIGYGSPLRGDDSAGYQLAFELENDRGITSIASHQLVPELAAEIAVASEVIFVDAYITNSHLAKFIITSLEELTTRVHDQEQTMTSHAHSPASLLNLAKTLYHTCPPATLIGIPAFNCSLGEQVSSATRLNMDLAADWIRKRIKSYA